MKDMNRLNQEDFSLQDTAYMGQALEEAAKAAGGGDVPVGAILVRNDTGEVLARGRNTRQAMGTALGHAEINAIAKACERTGGWRLENTTLYVTLEPCPMCAGAILHARIPRVVCGAPDPVAGAMGSVWAIHRHPVESKHTRVELGCMEEECSSALKSFFATRRLTE